MRRRTNRSFAGSALLRGLAAAAVLVIAAGGRPEPAPAREACAPYVSGGASNPAFGSLIGSMTVRECSNISAGYQGTGAGYQQCITYDVGYYDMGTYTARLDCRTYTAW